MDAMVHATVHTEGEQQSSAVRVIIKELEVECETKSHHLPDGRLVEFRDAYVEFGTRKWSDFSSRLEALGLSVGCRYFFRFGDTEYEEAPLYRLLGLGNTPKAYMKSDGSGFQTRTFCRGCGIKYREQVGPLPIDTNRLKSRPAVWVDGEYLVVSEQVATLLGQWQVSGCELVPVAHRGKGTGTPAFQVKATSTLPAWSAAMRFLYPPHLQDRPCPTCDLKRRLEYPFHYDALTVAAAKDINLTSDFVSGGEFTGRVIVISARLRRLVLQSGLALDFRHYPAEQTDERHWTFEPVVVAQ